MTDRKLVDLLNRLVDKTMAGEVKWEETENPNIFQVSFKNYAVRIASSGSRDEAFGLSMFNAAGTMIESATDEDLSRISGTSSEKMKTLFHEARKQARGFDTAIDDILEELK